MEGRRAIVSQFHRKSGPHPGHISVSNIDDDVSAPPLPNVGEKNAKSHRDSFHLLSQRNRRKSLYKNKYLTLIQNDITTPRDKKNPPFL